MYEGLYMNRIGIIEIGNNEITVRDAYIGDEDAIKKEISIYKGKGYKIIS